MSGVAVVALILATVWLGVLTLVLILTIRQVGLLIILLSDTSSVFSTNEGALSLASDGPEIGSTVPEDVASALRGLKSEQISVLFISATCAPCHELINGLRGKQFSSSVVALVAGRKELADDLVARMPLNAHIIRDPDATKIARGLQIQSTPFALAIDHDTVTHKGYMRQAADFIAFVETHGHAKMKVPSPKEVTSHAV